MLTNGSTGQMFAVTIFVKARKNTAIKNFLGGTGRSHGLIQGINI
jgi:hypothetical protein